MLDIFQGCVLSLIKLLLRKNENFSVVELVIVLFVKDKQNERNNLRCSQEIKLLAVLRLKLNSALQCIILF